MSKMNADVQIYYKKIYRLLMYQTNQINILRIFKLNYKLKIGEMFQNKHNKNIKFNGLMIAKKYRMIPLFNRCGNKLVGRKQYRKNLSMFKYPGKMSRKNKNKEAPCWHDRIK